MPVVPRKKVDGYRILKREFGILTTATIWKGQRIEKLMKEVADLKAKVHQRDVSRVGLEIEICQLESDVERLKSLAKDCEFYREALQQEKHKSNYFEAMFHNLYRERRIEVEEDQDSEGEAEEDQASGSEGEAEEDQDSTRTLAREDQLNREDSESEAARRLTLEFLHCRCCLQDEDQDLDSDDDEDQASEGEAEEDLDSDGEEDQEDQERNSENQPDLEDEKSETEVARNRRLQYEYLRYRFRYPHPDHASTSDGRAGENRDQEGPSSSEGNSTRTLGLEDHMNHQEIEILRARFSGREVQAESDHEDEDQDSESEDSEEDLSSDEDSTESDPSDSESEPEAEESETELENFQHSTFKRRNIGNNEGDLVEVTGIPDQDPNTYLEVPKIRNVDEVKVQKKNNQKHYSDDFYYEELFGDDEDYDSDNYDDSYEGYDPHFYRGDNEGPLLPPN